jgi:hypothetical protein
MRRTTEGGTFRLEIVAADLSEPDEDRADPAAFIEASFTF